MTVLDLNCCSRKSHFSLNLLSLDGRPACFRGVVSALALSLPILLSSLLALVGVEDFLGEDFFFALGIICEDRCTKIAVNQYHLLVRTQIDRVQLLIARTYRMYIDTNE